MRATMKRDETRQAESDPTTWSRGRVVPAREVDPKSDDTHLLRMGLGFAFRVARTLALSSLTCPSSCPFLGLRVTLPLSRLQAVEDGVTRVRLCGTERAAPSVSVPGRRARTATPTATGSLRFMDMALLPGSR